MCAVFRYTVVPVLRDTVDRHLSRKDTFLAKSTVNAYDTKGHLIRTEFLGRLGVSLLEGDHCISVFNFFGRNRYLYVMYMLQLRL